LTRKHSLNSLSLLPSLLVSIQGPGGDDEDDEEEEPVLEATDGTDATLEVVE
jgi:hypothetical protein